MLEGLDAIDWAALRHAYGPARDVLWQLRALLDADAGVREKALWALFGNIHHQGSVFEATVYAVPFLVDIAAALSSPARAEVLALLGCIARGYSYREDYEAGVPDEERWMPPCFGREEPDGIWSVRCRRAIAAECARIGALLDDGDPRVRSAVAYLLAPLRQCVAQTAPALARAARFDPDETARAAAWLALGELAAATDGDALRTALGSPSGLVRFAAARAALASGVPPDDAIVDEVMAVACAPKEIEDAWATLPWEGVCAAHEEATRALESLRGDRSAALAPRLLDALRAMDWLYALPVLNALLAVAFHGRAPGVALTPTQREAVRAVADHDGVWEHRNHLMVKAALERHQLPGTREALRPLASAAR